MPVRIVGLNGQTEDTDYDNDLLPYSDGSSAAVGKDFLVNTLPGVVTRFKRRGKVSIGLFDVDELTIINKKYGTAVGDSVLHSIAATLRNEDCLKYSGRCGDDTFYAILLDCDIEKAKSIAETVRLK